MEKRLILAIALSIAVLIGYQYYFSSAPKGPETPVPERAVPKGAKDNAAAVAPSLGTAPAGVPPGGVAPKAAQPVRPIAVKTRLFTATVSTEGGGLQSLSLNDYKDAVGAAGKPLNIIGSGAFRPLPLDLYLEETQPALPALPVYASEEPDTVSVGAGEKKSVRLTWEGANGIRIVREYLFNGDAYDFEVRVQVANGSKEPFRIHPGLELSQLYTGELAGDSYSFAGAVVDTAGKVERFDLKDIAKGKAGKIPVRWAAADEKYFTLILIPEKDWTLEKVARVGEHGVRLSVTDQAATVAPGESVRFGSRVYAGPKKYSVLDGMGKNLQALVDYGWFAILAKPLVLLMKASNRVTNNYGIDIIILTILIKILFYPLTKKSMTSMKKMQDLAPILAKLKEKYKDDPSRLNQETMQLYKTYHINPLSGCLPMLAQIPVFIALYKGLLVTIELRHSPFLLWINDLSAPEHLWDLSVAGYAIPIRLLPLLMGISMFVQQKMTPTPGGDPAQQKMMLFMPVIMTFMFWGFPTGLVIYWLVNNLLSIGQQLLHIRQDEAAKEAGEAKA